MTTAVTRLCAPVLRHRTPLKRAFRGLLAGPWRILARLCADAGARRGYPAALYYTFFSRAFHREQRAVLAGQARYHYDQASPIGSAVLLRRNVHRLEKGLLMRPRRTPFARDYIEDTVACYERACQALNGTCRVVTEELKWGHDVLQAYFDAMSDEPWLRPLRHRFSSVPAPPLDHARCSVPYKRNLETPAKVPYDDLLALAWRRRSVRCFLQQPVPRDLIDRAVTVAGLSPSACNRQPFVFRVVDDPELLKRVVAIPLGLQGYGDTVPAVVVLVGRQRYYFDERDRHLIYIDGSLAAMAFLFALESLGLSSCCVNWPDIADREAKMSKALRLDPDERPVMLIALGYPDPDGLVAFSQKRPLEQLRRYNLEP